MPSRVHIKASRLDPQELRFSLLFWDKLDFPINNVMHFQLDPEGTFLQSAGILQRTPMEVPFVGVGEALINAHTGAFRLLDAKEPGVWSLATGENATAFSAEDLEVGRGALVSLHRAIPVPDKDVPLHDILDFRVKRRDELIALRHHVEKIYQRVIAAGDGELALQTETERLQVAVADHIKASRESGFKFRLTDFDASLNLGKLLDPDVFAPVAAAAGAIYLAELPLIPTLLPVGAAVLSLKLGPSLKRHTATPTPFKYVSSYHKELF